MDNKCAKWSFFGLTATLAVITLGFASFAPGAELNKDDNGIAYKPYPAASTDLLKQYDSDYQNFKGLEIADKIVYFQQRKIEEAIVQMDYILYHFDKQTQKLQDVKVHWREDLPERLPKIISKEQANMMVGGQVRYSGLFYICPNSPVFPVETTPSNPCWVVETLINNRTDVLVIDAVKGKILGHGVPPPSTGFSCTGPIQYSYQTCSCSDGWYAWYENAISCFNAMGYSTEGAIWPTEQKVKSHIQSDSTAVFYELAHGGSGSFAAGFDYSSCYLDSTTAGDIETWIADYEKMPFTFIGSCDGMCDTTDNTLSYEFRKGSNENTATVGYCGMSNSPCADSCWYAGYTVPWQDTLFNYIIQGWTVKAAFDKANASYPGCGSSGCMRFAGDVNFGLVPVIYRIPRNYTLSVNSSGASDVNISSSTGHSGTTDYIQMVAMRTNVTLTAPAASGDATFTGWTSDVTDSNKTIAFTVYGDMNVTANFISITPMLHPEPNITPGLCNIISWSAASETNAFYAECSSDPCFLVVDYNSGWITRTSHQFCGLNTCQEYWYRVKSGLSAWSQTSQAEFQSDNLIDTTTTSGGDVTLFANITDAAGGTTHSFGVDNDGYFNGFLVTTGTTLAQIEVYLDILNSCSIEFAVYEGGASFYDQYNRIHSSTLASSGTGTKFYASGPISVPLQAGRHYMIGAVSSGSVTTYYDEIHSSLTFADHIGWGYTGFPSSNILTDIGNDPITFYHRYTTAQATGSGSVVSTPINLPAGSSWDVVDFNTTTPPNTELTVDILPATGSTPITGYENVPIGADLGEISDPTIRLRANLSTNYSNSTPALHDWSVTYTDPAGMESYWSNIESSIQVIPGDFEPDCDVDWYDFAVLANQWRQPPETPSADIAPLPQGDGSVNFLDFAEFAFHWLER